MPDYGIKKRDWEIYVAAETLEDIPVDQSRDRTWLRGMPAGFGRKHTATATTLERPMRRFPAPWIVQKIAGGFKVLDAKDKPVVPR